VAGQSAVWNLEHLEPPATVGTSELKDLFPRRVHSDRLVMDVNNVPGLRIMDQYVPIRIRLRTR